ncbi:hypothetical protein LTR78_006908 [Recurvomyces mirabilis]|uniref:Uncharacterized protein n=1 Tax=Recurvomyces mirabilis TaxID=574656 RepID=A0AAE0WKG0_9PEZI|nr:hypothetical protein LTR78_006908 [Recurvomyces mirabilis]KAK5153101.1 hypothetical protein LTS14_007745 [Recurvomyces mirabilis]
MSTVHVLGHVVRRGVEVAQNHIAGISPETIARLQHDAALREKTGDEVKPWELLPILIPVILSLVLVASIRYTIGDVMASLAMIESPSSTAIIEPRSTNPPKYAEDAPPAYSDEPDAPIAEKEAFIPTETTPESDVDVEVTVISHKPITSKIVATIGLLHRTGGFRARWRGLGLSILYHGLHGTFANLLAGLMGFGFVGHFFSYIFVSIGLMRVHMVWTHSMIAAPSAKPWYRRIVPRKQCRALLLPSLVFAVAQQAAFILPVAVAFAVGLPNIKHEHLADAANHENCGKMVLMGLRFLAVPATAIFVALAVLLPAAVTLTRVEALLLPEDEQTIVPFDKAAIMGDIDLSAWRSFDRSARLRIIKLYAKMVMAQFTIIFVGLHLALLSLFVMGSDRIVIAVKSAAAELQLIAIEAHKEAIKNGAQ